ncbi:hypothetical protein N7495_001874 [Penicillium taxi]|uniref:uncharacterized protein n=1 Tax=Penicillium taxi TaxID=168475 RepID=UPI002545380D|nr:uncharacterized protein N7495_001874 [Penicillium taxi]KAJ5909192.1 hypothetical protein N7495_001874 [Penicillium taxi]
MRYTSEDFDSLPPAVRRKFFSNVERLRMRLAQVDPISPTFHHARDRVNARNGPGSLHPSALRSSTRSGLDQRSLQNIASPQLQSPGLADSQCFYSLPAKIQLQLFSPEERRRLRQAYRHSLILDAADEAFYRRDQTYHSKSHSQSQFSDSKDSGSLPSDSTIVAQPTSVFYDSDSEEDWDHDSIADQDLSMDQSFYDSFRWLDEDGDLDLSLDEYHAHVVDSSANTKGWHRPSFRRSLSFSSHPQKNRVSTSTPIMQRNLPTSQSVPPLTSSRPVSRHLSGHVPQLSTSSMDPGAQYYQDPDARLKLRVYLASPQKFDEAIEFGFPAMYSKKNKENVAPISTFFKSINVETDFVGTFFEDDDGTVVGSPGGSVEEIPCTSQYRHETQRQLTDAPTLTRRRQSFLLGSKAVPQLLPDNREATLKMTLTRPDLRTESPTPSHPSLDDPLKLAELPPADRQQHIWDSSPDEQGTVRKMWRKLRRCV